MSEEEQKKEPLHLTANELLGKLMPGLLQRDEELALTPEQEERINAGPSESVDPVEQSIETIVAMHLRAEHNVNSHQRAIEAITSSVGRPTFFYGTILVVSGWVALNLLLPVLGRQSFDAPPFYWLQGVVGLCALLMTTVVLITQRRQSAKEERRMQLNLQINLISERKVTKLIELVEELRRDLPQVRNRHDPQAEAMKEYIDPREVLRTLSQMLKDPAEEFKSE